MSSPERKPTGADNYNVVLIYEGALEAEEGEEIETPSQEQFWANIVRVAKVTKNNLQNELEYLEDNIGGTGSVSNASNVGSGGIGFFKQKSGTILEFKNINAGSNKISVTDDTVNNEVDIDVDSSNIDHGSLSGLANDNHSQYLLVNGSRAMTGDLNLGNHVLYNTTEIHASSSGINFRKSDESMIVSFDDDIIAHCNLLPTEDVIYSLGAIGYRWLEVRCLNLYAGDILLNYGWRITEDENGVYLMKNNKRYKFKLEEVS